jgi:branched-chain amino acid transport system ATP-binding protein
MTNPELLLMDEPSEGLAPLIIQELGNIIKELHNSGHTIFLVEQNLRLALKVAQYVYILSKGAIVYQSTVEDLRNNYEIQAVHLGVTGKSM